MSKKCKHNYWESSSTPPPRFAQCGGSDGSPIVVYCSPKKKKNNA